MNYYLFNYYKQLNKFYIIIFLSYKFNILGTMEIIVILLIILLAFYILITLIYLTHIIYH